MQSILNARALTMFAALGAMLVATGAQAAPNAAGIRQPPASAAQSGITVPKPQLAGAQGVEPLSRSKLNCEVANGTGAALSQAPAPGTSHLIVALADNIAWQPRDGRIRFTITTTDNTAPSSINGIEAAVCFGWPQKVFTSADTEVTERFYAGAYLRTVARTENSITYETGLPDGLWDPTVKNAPTVKDVLWTDFINRSTGHQRHVYDGLGLVPIVHMRVVSRTQGSVDIPNDPNLLDTVLPLGISFQVMAVGIMLLAVGVSWSFLIYWSERRGIRGGFILRIISNRAGYASLTQFQILLWTVVIGAGLTYVMAITGSLIDVPVQELALLGIAGASALSATVASNRSQENQQDNQNPPDSLASSRRVPQWADLVVWDGTNEIDITRVQMLGFTVLAAGFVAIKICDESTIPTIPDGIILLMGLANGVYVGGRFVGKKKPG